MDHLPINESETWGLEPVGSYSLIRVRNGRGEVGERSTMQYVKNEKTKEFSDETRGGREGGKKGKVRSQGAREWRSEGRVKGEKTSERRKRGRRGEETGRRRE
jgi:hypothetical protein